MANEYSLGKTIREIQNNVNGQRTDRTISLESVQEPLSPPHHNSLGRDGMFAHLDSAYQTIRLLRPFVLTPVSDCITIPAISSSPSHQDLAAFKKAYGLIWCITRSFLKKLTGCHCADECVCPEEVEDLTAKVREKLEKHFASSNPPWRCPSAAIFTMCRWVFWDKLRFQQKDPIGRTCGVCAEDANDQISGLQRCTDDQDRIYDAIEFAEEWVDRSDLTDQDKRIFRQWFVEGEHLAVIAKENGISITRIFRKQKRWVTELQTAFRRGEYGPH